MTPILITPPAVEPLSIAETKAWLRIEGEAEDDIVGALIGSARLVVESLTRRLLVVQTWRLVLDDWPARGVTLPFSPVRSVIVRTFDASGAATTTDPEQYRLDAFGGDVTLIFTGNAPQPGRPHAGIEIDVEAGFADNADGVPAPLRQAMRILVARWYENRGDVEADGDMALTPASVAALVAPYRRVRLS
jgi:uncharacterized phiE125 gp8 family phage protein